MVIRSESLKNITTLITVKSYLHKYGNMHLNGN